MPKEKEEKTPQAPEKIAQLIAAGIPVSRAEFQGAVNNNDDVPETFFDIGSANASRRVQMIWTPYGLFCFHKGLKGDWFTVPLPMVKHCRFERA